MASAATSANATVGSYYLIEPDYINDRPAHSIEDEASTNMIEKARLVHLSHRYSRIQENGLKIKLRKSYQNQINDLPGRNKIESDNYIQQLHFQKVSSNSESKSDHPGSNWIGATEKMRFRIPDEALLKSALEVHVGPIPEVDLSIFNTKPSKLSESGQFSREATSDFDSSHTSLRQSEGYYHSGRRKRNYPEQSSNSSAAIDSSQKKLKW